MSTAEHELGIEGDDFRKAANALERAGFDRVAGRFASRALHRAANAVRSKVRAAVRPHRRTGHLSSGVRTRFTGLGMDTVAVVKSTGPVAHLIAGGVKPHEIGPPPYRRGNSSVMAIRNTGEGRSAASKSLISISGAVGYATVVQSPGFAADPYFERGVRASVGDINAIVKDAGEAMVKDLALRVKGK